MGRRVLGRQFDPASVDYHVEPNVGGMLHRVTASSAGTKLGYLEWDSRDGEVAMVHTEHAARGLGVATGMWQHAHAGAQRHGLVAPKHSQFQLPDGARWANSMTAKSGPRRQGTRRLTRAPLPGQESMF